MDLGGYYLGYGVALFFWGAFTAMRDDQSISSSRRRNAAWVAIVFGFLLPLLLR